MKNPGSKPEWATRLTAIRTLTGMTQGAFAEALGMSQQRYGLYETGRSEPNIETLLKIATLTGHSVDYILRGGKIGLIPQPEADDAKVKRGTSSEASRKGTR